MKTALSEYCFASCANESVTGPQNLLRQKTGVENRTKAGSCCSIASAIVVWCSSGSGIAPLPAVNALESIVDAATPFEDIVSFCVFRAISPGAGYEGRATASNFADADWVLPSARL